MTAPPRDPGGDGVRLFGDRVFRLPGRWQPRLAAAAALAVVLAPLAGLPPIPDSPRPEAPSVLDPARYGGVMGPDLAFFSGPDAATPSPEARGAVYAADRDQAGRFWGTHIGGDGYTGKLTSAPFTLTSDFFYLPIMGYPTRLLNEAGLEILDAGGQPVERVIFHGANPRETPGVWEIDVRNWRGRAGRLVLEDGTTDLGGWLGVGRPIFSDRPGGLIAPRWLRETHYGRFLLGGCTVAVLLLLPGWYLRRTLPHGWWAATAFLPLPGLLLLAACGVMLWLSGQASSGALGRIYLGGHALLAARLMLFDPGGRTPGPARSRELWPLGLWAAAVMVAASIGASPLPVAEEFYSDSTLPGRMVASPPDHTTTHYTAAYFWHGKNGREDTQAYFGKWSPVSRGPLVPFAALTLLTVFGHEPTDPPSFSDAHWPVASDGAYLSRLLGWMTNAIVVLAAARLLAVLGAGPTASRLGAAWMVLAPLTVINTVFLWPKLLAAAFILHAAADLLRGRTARAGLWSALAWLSHPIGALFLPALALLGGHRAWQEARAAHGTPSGRTVAGLREMAVLALVVLAAMAPWLAFRAWVGPADSFLRYPLGDGRGDEFPEYEIARSAFTWLQARWDNIRLTLVPFAFVASDRMQAWIGGPLGEPLRWTVQYAKTLPGNLGFAGFALACLALCRPGGWRRLGARVRLVWWHLGGTAFAVMVVFWGFSSDGYGRNCLEPLSAAVIVATAAGWTGRIPVAVPLLLGLVWLEGAWVMLSGFAGAQGFHPTSVPADGWTAGVVGVLAGGIVVAWVTGTWHRGAASRDAG